MFTAWTPLLVVSGAVEGQLDFARCDWLVRGGEWQVPRRNDGCTGVAFLGEMWPSWPKQRLSHKSGPPVDRRYVHHAHVRAYCSLSPKEFSTKGLRAYGRSPTSGNGALKYTKNRLFYCRISTFL